MVEVLGTPCYIPPRNSNAVPRHLFGMSEGNRPLGTPMRRYNNIKVDVTAYVECELDLSISRQEPVRAVGNMVVIFGFR
jgi:hypothetical protein